MTRQNRLPWGAGAPVAAKVALVETQVASGAVASLRRLGLVDELATLNAPATVRDLRQMLGDVEIRRIIGRLGHTPPSGATMRRWDRQNRIPRGDIAEVLERHRVVSSMGGIKAAAQALRRSESSVRKWLSGRQQNFRGEAQNVMAEARVRERMVRAGVMTPGGRLKTPVVKFRADTVILMPGPDGYSYNVNRIFNFDPSLDNHAGRTTGLSADETWALAAAVATDRIADVVAILENHASLEYAQFTDYSAEQGMHFESFDDLDIVWR